MLQLETQLIGWLWLEIVVWILTLKGFPENGRFAKVTYVIQVKTIQLILNVVVYATISLKKVKVNIIVIFPKTGSRLSTLSLSSGLLILLAPVFYMRSGF